MLSVPKFKQGVAQLRWEQGIDGNVWYTVQRAGGPPVQLNAGMTILALMADGRRTLGDIHRDIQSAGFDVEDPAVVVLTFRQLELAGTCGMTWSLHSAGPVRHTCVACGQSCEGQFIGPLSNREVERLLQYREQLRTLEPDLPDLDPIVLFEGANGPRPGLNTTPGRCVFLGKDRLCTLHKHFGPTSKPLNCQLFPLRVIETEEGFRVGISSRCARTNRSFASAPPLTAEEAFTGLGLRRPPGDLVGLDPRNPRALAPTPAFRRQQEDEAWFLALLNDPELTLATLVASSDGTLRRRTSLPRAWMGASIELLQRFVAGWEPDPLNHPESEFGAGVRRFFDDIRALGPAAPADEPPAPARDLVVQALRQLVYLRETTAYGGVTVGVQVALLGAVAALWTARPLVENGVASDALAERLAYWLRIHNGGRAAHQIFADSLELAAHLAVLGEAEA